MPLLKDLPLLVAARTAALAKGVEPELGVWCVVHVHAGMGPRLGTLWTATVGARSWLCNDVGAASVSIPKVDADPRLLAPDNVYVVESGTGLDSWVGYRPERIQEDRDTVTLPLRELTHLLAQRFTGEDETSSAGAGRVLADALRAAHQRQPLPFALGDFGDAGPYTSRTWNVTALLDVARQLAQDSGYQWWPVYAVTPAAIAAELRWGARRGGDRTTAVVLRDGHGGNLAADGLALEHRQGLPFGTARVVGGTNGATAFAARPTAQAKAGTAAALGREKAVVSERISDARAAQQAADAALAEGGGVAIRAACADPDLWRLLGLDETVAVELGSEWNLGRGLTADVRVLGVQPDEQVGVMELTLAVEGDSGAFPRWGAGVARALPRPDVDTVAFGPDLLALVDEAHPLRQLNQHDERIAMLERRG
jgi:hypothetical protein